MAFGSDPQDFDSHSSHSRGVIADINITPLVDVMLVLLIVFMITAPLAVSGVNVQLPAADAKPMQLNDNPLIISIDASGSFFIGKSAVPSAELIAKLQGIKGSKKEMTVYIRADRAVPYGRVMESMAAAHAAGIYRIGMLGEGQSGRK